MKKKFSLLLILSLIATSVLVGCGETTEQNDTNVSVETEAPITTQEPTETPHEHSYIETITTEATCETDGVKTFACECGDNYTETITATGHIYENYISNNDATYLADGTETAKCNGCELTDTRTAEGSKLEYTYTDMDVTMYAQKTVNVRSMPSTDGEKLGGLSTNDEVKVTGQCNETSWYRIEYDGNIAYVSDSYLGNDKVVVQTEAPAQSTSEFPYELYVIYYDEVQNVKYYYKPSKATFFDYPQSVYDECMAWNRANSDVSLAGTIKTQWKTADGDTIIRYNAW